MFTRTVLESKTQPRITFVETRSGTVMSFMCAKKGGYDDLTREIFRHFDSYGFLNPVIAQCDKKMSIIDVCRKLARERKARSVLRFASKTCHQSSRSMHGHIQGLARCYQTQIEMNTDILLSATYLAIPFLQFVTLDLCSQDSQCDATEKRHPNICPQEANIPCGINSCVD